MILSNLVKIFTRHHNFKLTISVQFNVHVIPTWTYDLYPFTDFQISQLALYMRKSFKNRVRQSRSLHNIIKMIQV